jgi:hypothetical protein
MQVIEPHARQAEDCSSANVVHLPEITTGAPDGLLFCINGNNK